MKKEHCNQKRNKILLVQEFLYYSDGYTRTNIIRVVKIMQLYGLTLEKWKFHNPIFSVFFIERLLFTIGDRI